MVALDAWFASGQRVRVGQVNLACHVSGEGSCVTLLHGFPTCSWDWAAVANGLLQRRVVIPDLLGFGDSDKPPGHEYSLMEQADLIVGLWAELGVTATSLVAHDIGATVALELLARQDEGRLSTQISRVVLLNSALYVGLSKPKLSQRLVANGVLGPVMERFVNERSFTRALASVFAKPLPDEVAHQYWLAFQRRATTPIMHALLQYIPERTRNRARWEGTLERTSVPLQFIWGMADPVSGSAVAERLPKEHLVALDSVGHYPQLEAPEAVLAELRATL
jgi:pimeloyl-ACP methyl ester carboxylesterase